MQNSIKNKMENYDDGGETEALDRMERAISIGEYMNCGLTLDEASDKVDRYLRSLK